MSLTSGTAVMLQAGNEGVLYHRGTGYAISPKLILTARYIAQDQLDTEHPEIVAHPLGSEQVHPCRVVWVSSSERSVAVLRVNDTKAPPAGPQDIVVFARFIGDGERECTAIGFPQSQFGEPEALRITGTVDPGEFPGSQNLLFRPSRPLAGRAGGLGGAALCTEGRVVGIITGINESTGAFAIAPIAELMEDAGFRDALKRELGHVPEPVDLPPPEEGILDALIDVSQADPTNIQQVAASQFRLSSLYYENVLSQARRSFNAAVAAAVTGLVFFLAAVTFAMTTSQLAAPLVSLLGGGVVEVVAGLNFWLYGRTAHQLNSFHLRLERMQRFLVANSVSISLSGDRREDALVELVRVIAAVEPPEPPPPQAGP